MGKDFIRLNNTYIRRGEVAAFELGGFCRMDVWLKGVSTVVSVEFQDRKQTLDAIRELSGELELPEGYDVEEGHQ